LAPEVRVAVEAADAGRVRDLVVQASEKDRRAAAKKLGDRLDPLVWSWEERLRTKRRAALAAWLGTATARQIASDWWLVGRRWDSDVGLDLAYAIGAARGRSFVETVARNSVSDGAQTAFLLVRCALREGLVDDPGDGDAYVRGMVQSLGAEGDAEAAYRALVADPELLEDELWRIFEVDCGTELSHAHVWERNPGSSMARPGANRWHRALLRLAAGLARAAAGPLSQKQKNLAVDMRRLLERAAEREPEARPALLAAAALALGHERPDVQERALALVERHADEAPRAELLRLAETVAPQLRGRVE